MFHILRNTLNVNKHVMYSHNVWTINDCFRRSCFTIHSLVNTLDKNQFIEDLMDEEREINYESDVSLFDIKYFTPKTLSLLNIKFNEKNTNCFNSLMTREISRANIANYVISDGVDYTTDSLTTQLKNFTDNENAIDFFRSIAEVMEAKKMKRSGNEEAIVSQFVMNLLFAIGLNNMTHNYKISMDLMNNYRLPVRLSGRPDLSFKDKEDNIWLILELKKPNDNYSEVEKYKSQTIGYGITSFFNNLVNESSSGVLSSNYDKQLINTRHAVLIRGMRFHFFEISINGKHLDQLNQTIDYTDDYIQSSNIFIDVTEWPTHGKGLNYCRFNDRIHILLALELIYSLRHRFSDN
ncbi:uncharacterized protein LOC128957758 [Oppia nitens]|uniref:uncharacterized protein LOC128957758 n=1 Tax=Oppia nitens TaxID=1686743 RepID=UPI0023DB86F1|nr:uncharacterized protein LOC128957758 [Oppia nitens]